MSDEKVFRKTLLLMWGVGFVCILWFLLSSCIRIGSDRSSFLDLPGKEVLGACLAGVVMLIALWRIEKVPVLMESITLGLCLTVGAMTTISKAIVSSAGEDEAVVKGHLLCLAAGFLLFLFAIRRLLARAMKAFGF